MNPLIFMTAVTGKPTKSKIEEYLRSVKDAGVEQCMIYPRKGCEMEYLSEEWFSAVQTFLETAEKLGMNIWLYDEYNWPSGDAGGRVTAVEEYRLQAISVKGDSIGEISTHSMNKGSLFAEQFFPNLLSENAVNCFITCTHEEYYKRFKQYFGSVIKGIFTDEPSVGYCCGENRIAYYDGMSEDYRALCGRDFFDDIKNSHKDLYSTAAKVIAQQFNKCYIGKLHSWCKEHGIIMTGHLMADDSPHAATMHSGDLLKNLSSFMLPGIDDIFTDFRNEYEMSLFGTAEYASGEHGAMAELFALGPCDMSYAKKRCMLYFCGCHKISHYFLAISHMDMRGNAKIKDFFNNFASDQPDFQGMRLLAAEAGRAAAYAKKDFSADVYIRYPTRVCAANMLNSVDMAPFYALINQLTHHQIQWKFVDEGDTFEPLIDFTEQFDYVYNGKQMSDFNQLLHMIKSEALVTDENGDLPNGLFVRKFNDGNVVALNLYGKAGKYRVNGKEIFLDEFGVFCSEEPMIQTKVKQPLTGTLNICYDNPNIIRTMHINNKPCEIVCEEDMPLVFASRNDSELYVNNEKIKTDVKNNHLLSPGLKELYHTSERMVLPKGIHIVTASADCKYLPSAFAIGDFSVQITNGKNYRLFPRRSTCAIGEKLEDFGTITFSLQVEVPLNAKALEITGTTLYTSVYIDQTRIGEKICSPYIFETDSSLCGKTVCLKIVQHSSMGAIFGDIAYRDSVTHDSQWNHMPQPKKTQFGFCEINWISDSDETI